MPQAANPSQYNRVLNALHSTISYLRDNPEKRPLVLQRLESLSSLSRACVRYGASSRIRYLADVLQRELPGQIRLLRGSLNSDTVVADAIDRMINRVSSLPDAAFVDRGYAAEPDAGKERRKLDQGYEADAEDNAEDSDMDPGDDNYLARILLDLALNEPVIDIEICLE